jgi:hemerythrin-like domain-containing protein
VLVDQIEEHTMKITKQILKEIIDEELRDYVRGQTRSPDVEVPGGGVRSVKGVKRGIMENLEDAMQAAQRGDFGAVATRVANLEAFIEALKKVGEIK